MQAEACLIGPHDPSPYRLLNDASRVPLLLVCDHASRAVPRALAGLGLPEAELERHIGWDIGAARVTERLAEAFGACAVLSGYSRLVIDCNRAPGDASSIPEASDGTAIPGNRGLSDAELAARIDTFFWPYHHAITRVLAAFGHHGQVPVVLGVHSFTPRMNGFDRPWDVGVLWNHDPRLAVPLIEALRAQGLVVGDNEPYSGRDTGYTVEAHAGSAGLPHAVLELRQDRIASEAGCREWADRLATVLPPLLARPELARVEFF